MGVPFSQTKESITLTNDQTFNYKLGRSFAGLNIDYTIQNNGSNNVTFQKTSAQSFIYSNGIPSPSNMVFAYSYGLTNNSFAYFLQDKNNKLWQQKCTVDGDNYNCQNIEKYSLSGPITAFAIM